MSDLRVGGNSYDSWDLNRMADDVLDTFGNWGGQIESFRKSSTSNDLQNLQNTIGAGGLPGAIKDYGYEMYRQAPAASSEKGVWRGLAAGTKTSWLGNSFGFLSSVGDAMTGVGDVFVGVHNDRANGDNSYRESLVASLKATGNIATSYATGTAIGSAVTIGGAAALGVVTAPAWLTALAVGAGVGGAYYVGKKYQQLLNWF